MINKEISVVFNNEYKTVYYKNKNMLFDKGQRGDIILILTAEASKSRRVNHAGIVVSANGDGTYETIEGNTGSGISQTAVW